MEQILHTTQLEEGKSTYTIDWVKHNEKLHYVSILQTIEPEHGYTERHLIRVHAALLSDLINALSNMLEASGQQAPKNKTQKLHDRADEIVKRHLNGVMLEHLAVQFDTTVDDIRKVLFTKGVEIVEGSQTKPPYWIGRWGRKKRKKP